MNQFWDTFEADVCGLFKIWPEDKREEIQEIFRKETEVKQKILEDEALKIYTLKI